MSEIAKLREDFHAKIKALQDSCPHEEWTDWFNPHWAPGHPYLYEVRTCKRCDKMMDKRNYTLMDDLS